MAGLGGRSVAQLQALVAEMQRDLVAKGSAHAALQASYQTAAAVAHERAEQLEQAAQQLDAERSQHEELRQELEAARRRADALEARLSPVPERALQFQQEAAALRATHEVEQQQNAELQQQLLRLNKALAAGAATNHALSEQLQEQVELVRAATSAAADLKARLEEEHNGARATASQLQALRDIHEQGSAQQQDLEGQLAACAARAAAAEAAAGAEVKASAQLQGELQAAKALQASQAIRLLSLQKGSQQLEQQLARAGEAVLAQQVAATSAQTQAQALGSQLDAMLLRAQAAEAAAIAAAAAQSAAQQQAERARAAQSDAEEARKTAAAASGLLAQRLAEAQQAAALERGLLEAAQQELQRQLAQQHMVLQLAHQQQRGWQFRAVEMRGRLLGMLAGLEGRVQRLDVAAGAFADAVQAQHEEQRARLDEHFGRVACWAEHAEQLDAAGGTLGAALARVQQQWGGQQQRLRSSETAAKVLQKQLDQADQSLSMSALLEQRLRHELDEAQAARKEEKAAMQHEVQKAASALAAAEAAADAAQAADKQHQAVVAQLETRLAAADVGMVGLRAALSAGGAELAVLGRHVRGACRQLGALAASAGALVGTLVAVGALPQEDAALLGAKLGQASAAWRHSTACRPASPVSGVADQGGRTVNVEPAAAAGGSSGTSAAPRPDGAWQPVGMGAAGGTPDGGAAAEASAAASQPTAAAAAATAGASGAAASPARAAAAAAGPGAVACAEHMGEGLECLQQSLEALWRATQQLAEQRLAPPPGWERARLELAGVVAKLLHVEESLAANYSCLACTRLFDSPVAVVPCGHVMCRSCLLAGGGRCRECCSGTGGGSEGQAGGEGSECGELALQGDALACSFVPVPSLERLCAKFELRLVALQSLQRLVAQQQQLRPEGRTAQAGVPGGGGIA